MEIEASKCQRCSAVIIPPREICPYCGPEFHDLEQIIVEPSGVIASYTSLQRPPDGFDPPVVLALVRLRSGAMVLCLGSKDVIDDTHIGRVVSIDRDVSDRFIYKLME